jgi:hypothetical protein
VAPLVTAHAVQHLWYRPEVWIGQHVREIDSLAIMVAQSNRALAEQALSQIGY